MATLNIILAFQVRANLKLLGTRSTYSFSKEKYALVMILFFFELSYGLRFVWDVLIYSGSDNTSKGFGYYLAFDMVGFVDSLSFTALLLFHRKNFRE